MAIDPVNPLVDWLVSSALDAGIRLARGPGGERALRTATKLAIDDVIQQVDPEFQEALTESLAICFSAKIRVQLGRSENTGVWLRRAIAEQLDVLDQVEISPDNSFWDNAPFGRAWLYDQVTGGIVTALRQAISKNDPASLVHGIEIGEVLERLDSLSLRLTQSALTPSAEATRVLPRDISSFTGRASELGFLTGLADRTQSTGTVVGISAIDGMAGIGKTALALHTAHELSPRFPDGQLFLELHGHTPGQLPVEPGDALTSLLLTTGVPPQQIPEDVERRSRLWRQHISGKKIIIVLDDAAGFEQVRWLLPGTPESLVLITSRNRLSALEGAATITLKTMPSDDANEMLRRIADRRDLDDLAVSSEKIVSLCGHLPLAISVVARQLASHHASTATELADELAEARDRRTLMNTDLAAVTAAFDVSYRSMRGEVQDFFRGLGLHPGVNFDIYAGAALNQVDLITAKNILDDLLDRHLVTKPGRGRYQFHDLVRQYVTNLALTQEPSSNEAAIDRLFDYYLHTAALANIHLARRSRPAFSPVDHVPLWWPDLSTPDKSYSWMEEERPNLDSVIEYSVKTSRYRTVTELPAMMSGFLCTKGLWMHAIGLHYEALKSARESGQVHGQVVALNQLGHIQRLLSDYRQAIITQEQAAELANSSDDKQGLANARDSLGVVHYLQGNYEPSNECLLEALEIFTALDDPLGRGEALLHLGALQQATGQYPAARETLTQALGFQRQLGHTLGEAETLNYLGVVEYLTGDYRTSITTLTRAKELQRSLGDRLGEAEVLNNLGAVFCETGDYSQSIDNLRESLEIYEDLGNRRGHSSVLNNIGFLLLEMRDGEDAARILNQALHINRDIKNQRGEGNSLCRLGVAAARRSKYDSAITYLDEALAIFRTLGDRRGQAEVLNYLGDAYQESDLPRRKACHDEALAIAREISVPLEEAHALASLARVYFISEDSRKGAMYLSMALSILHRLGVSRNYIARHVDLEEPESYRPR